MTNEIVLESGWLADDIKRAQGRLLEFKPVKTIGEWIAEKKRDKPFYIDIPFELLGVTPELLKEELPNLAFSCLPRYFSSNGCRWYFKTQEDLDLFKKFLIDRRDANYD